MASRLMPRMLGLVFLLAMALPAMYFAREYVSEVKLYPGDVLEVRECRNCGGSGTNESFDLPELGERCVACRGKTTVEVILPGPERPTKVHGSVVQGELADPYGGESPIPLGSQLLSPLAGGVANAEVTLTPSSGDPIRVTTNSHGRFMVRLPPGFYTVSTVASGWERDERELEVEPLTEPIWLEHATILYEPETLAEQQSWYGLSLRIDLWE